MVAPDLPTKTEDAVDMAQRLRGGCQKAGINSLTALLNERSEAISEKGEPCQWKEKELLQENWQSSPNMEQAREEAKAAGFKGPHSFTDAAKLFLCLIGHSKIPSNEKLFSYFAKDKKPIVYLLKKHTDITDVLDSTIG